VMPYFYSNDQSGLLIYNANTLQILKNITTFPLSTSLEYAFQYWISNDESTLNILLLNDFTYNMIQSYSFPAMQLLCNYTIGKKLDVNAITGLNDLVYVGKSVGRFTGLVSYVAFNITQCAPVNSLPLPDNYSHVYGIISPLDPTIIYGNTDDRSTRTVNFVKLKYSPSAITVLSQQIIGVGIQNQITFLENNTKILVFANGSTVGSSLYAYILDLDLNILAMHQVAFSNNSENTEIALSTTNLFVGNAANNNISTLYQFNINGDFSVPQCAVQTEINAFRRWRALFASKSTIMFQINSTALASFDYNPSPVKYTKTASTASTAGSTGSSTYTSSTSTSNSASTGVSTAGSAVTRRKGGDARKKLRIKKFH